jgi:FMN phosphatase YigB (HAD superfamily)
VSPIRGYVFDAYGTLFDVHAVMEAGRAITADPAALSATWRQKQLEYTWLRALMGAYVDFWAVTEAALRHVISVDAVRTYKPSPLVYALGPGTLGIPAGELLFVSSNGWDVAGAKAFGYRVAWCNRVDAPEEELGVRADVVVRTLDQLPR